MFPLSIIYRHKKENLKKCSLSGLEGKSDLLFLTYPKDALPPSLENYFLLSFEGPVLSEKDCSRGLILLDGTWRYAQKMQMQLNLEKMEKRSLPNSIRTAYPRKQTDCILPQRGLASVEALFAAHFFLKRDAFPLLEHYYWKNQFLELNRSLFL